MPACTTFLFCSSADHPYLHSFPTRRSSDLIFDAKVSRHQRTVCHPKLRRFGYSLLVLPDTSQNSSQDRKSTRLNSSHVEISYAVFCLKKKNNDRLQHQHARVPVSRHGHPPS